MSFEPVAEVLDKPTEAGRRWREAIQSNKGTSDEVASWLSKHAQFWRESERDRFWDALDGKAVERPWDKWRNKGK